MTLVAGKNAPSPFKTVTTTISGSSTKEVDTIPLIRMKSVKYFVSLSNSTNTRYKSFELNAVNHNSVVRDTISHKVSTGIMSINVEMKVSGSNAVLEIINNETFDLDVELIKGVLNG